MKRICGLFVLIFVAFGCSEEQNIEFKEYNDLKENNAVVEINIPVAQGNSVSSLTINDRISNEIIEALDFSENDQPPVTVDEAISNFDDEYAKIKSDFPDSKMIWEATFDGEVTYQSSEVITIALSSYLNTGGAHGTAMIKMLNFDTKSGAEISFDSMILNMEDFQKLVETHFKKAISQKKNADFKDYFWDKGFSLPENMGLSEEGLICFYNVYEIAPYSEGATEFVIPFEDLENYLSSY